VAENLIGIDVGTTSVKASVIAPDGAVLARFSQSYPTERADQRVEQDPAHWTNLIDAALAKFGDHKVVALGLCSQVNTHVFVGEDGRALMPAIQWQDARAAEIAAELDAQVSEAQKIEWWGAPMPIDASHAISRMAWVARHRPEIWEKTRYVMLPKDFCIFHLTGRPSTDPLSNIGLVGADMGYVQGVFDLVPGAAGKMAPLVGVTECAGAIRNGAFKVVPVASGTMDAWAGLVGAGAGRDGRTVYLSGTSEIVGISSQTVTPTPGAIVFPPCNGVRLHAGPTNTGGDAQLWFSEIAGVPIAEISDMVAGTPRSAATPLFLPQLEGERAPLWNPDLRGAFMHVSRKTEMADFARAVQEGVAMSARHILDTLQASSGVNSDWIAGGGGGFLSDSWAQIRANVMGVPVHRLASDQPGVLGAAMIAGLAAGRFADLAAAESLVRYADVFEPEEDKVALYDSIFAIYKDAIDAQASIVQRLKKLTNGG
jgi:xylulokinase